jgi:hypothetical protein
MARQSPTTQFNCLSVTLTVWFWCCARRSELREPIAEQTVGSERSTQVSELGRPMMRCCKKGDIGLEDTAEATLCQWVISPLTWCGGLMMSVVLLQKLIVARVLGLR